MCIRDRGRAAHLLSPERSAASTGQWRRSRGFVPARPTPTMQAPRAAGGRVSDPAPPKKYAPAEGGASAAAKRGASAPEAGTISCVPVFGHPPHMDAAKKGSGAEAPPPVFILPTDTKFRPVRRSSPKRTPRRQAPSRLSWLESAARYSGTRHGTGTHPEAG